MTSIPDIPFFEDLAGQHWLLLIFSSKKSGFTLKAQFNELEKSDILNELKVFHVSELNIPGKFGQKIPSKYHPTLKDLFGIPEDEYTGVLLNPNLREKLRSNDVLSEKTLNQYLP